MDCRFPYNAGKVYGAQNLLQLSSRAALSAFQLFSSLAAFSGAAGQASYAAANGTLDAWAHASQVGLAVLLTGLAMQVRLARQCKCQLQQALSIPDLQARANLSLCCLCCLQGQGRPGLAVQWGNWGGGGMAVRNKGFIERMERMGLGIGELHGWACLGLRGTPCGSRCATAEGAMSACIAPHTFVVQWIRTWA